MSDYQHNSIPTLTLPLKGREVRMKWDGVEDGVAALKFDRLESGVYSPNTDEGPAKGQTASCKKTVKKM
jgi:hypothetical protein